MIVSYYAKYIWIIIIIIYRVMLNYELIFVGVHLILTSINLILESLEFNYVVAIMT